MFALSIQSSQIYKPSKNSKVDLIKYKLRNVKHNLTRDHQRVHLIVNILVLTVSFINVITWTCQTLGALRDRIKAGTRYSGSMIM